MNLEQKVTSQPTARRIAELCKEKGVVFPESQYIWRFGKLKEGSVKNPLEGTGGCGGVGVLFLEDSYNAYDVAELGEILPTFLKSKPGKHAQSLGLFKIVTRWGCTYTEGPAQNIGDDIAYTEGTMAECMGKMLIYLLENDLLK